MKKTIATLTALTFAVTPAYAGGDDKKKPTPSPTATVYVQVPVPGPTVYVQGPTITATVTVEKPVPYPVTVTKNRYALSVYFNEGSAALTPQTKLALNRAVLYAKLTKLDTIRTVGWTDASGGQKDAVDLSFKRAKAVRTYLLRALKGYDASAVGQGISYAFPNNTADGRVLNRRVDIVVWSA